MMTYESAVSDVARVAISPQADTMPARSNAAAASLPTASVTTKSVGIQEITTASVTQRPLGDIAEGVLLFPNSGETAVVPTLFSDTVEVRKLPDGTSVVVRIDTAGNQIGNEVPFVVVPVTQTEI